MRSWERVDDLQRKGYRLIQDPGKVCFGMDAVLLSSFAVVKRGERVLDLGTGTGVIPILLEAKTEGTHFTGLEIQSGMADMARRSVRLNGLEEKISIREGDLCKASALLGRAAFEVVTCNPPYIRAGRESPDPAREIARHEILCTLEDVVRETARVLRPGGRFYLVHRPQRLAEIFGSLARHRLEPKRLRMVHPFAQKEAELVLLEAVRGGKPGMTVAAPLIVYERPGQYSGEMDALYGGGQNAK